MKRKWPKCVGMVVALVGMAMGMGCANMAEVRMAEARSAMLAGDSRRASESLKLALKEESRADAHYYLALVELQQGQEGDREKALAHVRESIRLEPTGRAFLLRGALEEENDPQAAERSYRLGLEHAPEHSESRALLHRDLGALLAHQERWDEAAEHLDAYMLAARNEGIPVSDAERALWGTVLFQQNRDGEARAAWNAVRDEAWRRRLFAAAAMRSGQ